MDAQRERTIASLFRRKRFLSRDQFGDLVRLAPEAYLSDIFQGPSLLLQTAPAGNRVVQAAIAPPQLSFRH